MTVLAATFLIGALFLAALAAGAFATVFLAGVAFGCAARFFRPLGFGTSAGTGVDGFASPRILAHRAFCAKAIFRRAAALRLLRLGRPASDGAARVLPSRSMDRSSAI